MIRRLFLVALFTGFGHVLSLMVLKWMSTDLSTNVFSSIGEVESLAIILITSISFGLQLSSTRKIAIEDNWRLYLNETQSARLTLSLFFVLFGLFGFYDTKYFLLIFAPIFALNSDYALYGKGDPIFASYVAFLRILIPSLSLIVGLYFRLEYIHIVYFFSLIFSYLITGLLISKKMRTSYFIKPSLISLKLYIENLGIGVSNVLLTFFGLGLISLISIIYSDSVVSICFALLKIYVIFKGVRRILVQSFFKELIKEEVALKVDFIAINVGIVFLLAFSVFSKYTIPLVLSEEYNVNYSSLLLVGITGFVSSFSTSTATRLLLLNYDKKYVFNTIISVSSAILSIFLMYYILGDVIISVLISLLIGETIYTFLNIKAVNEKMYVRNRISHVKFSLIIVFVLLLLDIYQFNLLWLMSFLFIYIITLAFQSIKLLRKI